MEHQPVNMAVNWTAQKMMACVGLMVLNTGTNVHLNEQLAYTKDVFSSSKREFVEVHIFRHAVIYFVLLIVHSVWFKTALDVIPDVNVEHLSVALCPPAIALVMTKVELFSTTMTVRNVNAMNYSTFISKKKLGNKNWDG